MAQKPTNRKDLTSSINHGQRNDPAGRRETCSRRSFLGQSTGMLASAGLWSLLQREGLTAENGLLAGHHFAPRAKRVIYLFQSGGPSQLDLFDYKPALKTLRATELPDSVRRGQRLTGMTATQERFPIAPSIFPFSRRGQAGAWVSDLLPHTAKIADQLCFIKTMHTEAINHDPAITFFQTGAELAGRPSMGAWVQYGLGSLNDNLPAFVVMVSGAGGQPLYDRLWGSGFLPTVHQGIKFRSTGDPVLFLSDAPGIDSQARRQMLDDLAALNGLRYESSLDPEVSTRIAQYEMAFRMQQSVPDLTDISREPDSVFELYGDDARQSGTFAHNCLLARRLAERDVRFIQLFHRGWDQHATLPTQLQAQCKATDQASAALVKDLEQRGLLEDTLVIWGGEFGRTVYCQGTLTATDYGRDHHPRCFTMWLAGGGIRPGVSLGETDAFSYNILSNPVHVHDLNATMLHCLGIDHTRLTYKFQGRHFRLTDVHGELVTPIVS